MISERALDRLQEMFGAPDVRGTRYELRGVLGEGGLGVVYLAYDCALDREVALKVLTRDRPSDTARLQREARILARLEHPGIVPVHDVGELPDGRIFYAMKCVRGERLDRWAAAGADLRARLGVFMRICDAVSFAHALGIVHRDLKPENVMVGEFGEVLVLDWGLADERGASRSTRGGTPAYMAPEQARGGPTDERADIYALGTILCDFAADVPALAAIAAKARQPDRSSRYESVAELNDEIGRFLSDAAVRAHREGVVARAARFGRRYRLPILLVLTYILMRALLLWAFRI
jgi:eukaryotic-like serine/threonine-protein kinase